MTLYEFNRVCDRLTSRGWSVMLVEQGLRVSDEARDRHYQWPWADLFSCPDDHIVERSSAWLTGVEQAAAHLTPHTPTPTP